MIAIALVGGLLGMVVSLLLRRNTDRARAIRGSGGPVDDRFAFLSMPGFSLILLGFGALGLAMPLADGFAGRLLAALAVLVIAVGTLASLWGLFGRSVPSFALPLWMRR